MKITLTQKFIEVLTRYFEVHRSYFEDEVDNYHIWNTGDKIYVNFECEYTHKEYCDEYDNDRVDNTYMKGECKNCANDNGRYYINIITLDEDDKKLEKIEWKKDEELSVIEEKLSKLSGKTYSYCKCGAKSFKNDLCNYCYIHQHTRTEEEGGDCPICYENGGRWCILDCKHIFHMACIFKIKKEGGGGRKCPLCRNISEIKHDPYEKFTEFTP